MVALMFLPAFAEVLNSAEKNIKYSKKKIFFAFSATDLYGLGAGLYDLDGYKERWSKETQPSVRYADKNIKLYM